jgi:hypothetical protein
MSKAKQKSSGGSSGKQPRLRLDRSDLLPMANTAFRTISLRNHLALVSLRRGSGNAELAAELLKSAHLAYFIYGIEADEQSLEACVAAELTIKASVAHARMANEWLLNPRHTHYVEEMLCRHDTQLTTLPRHTIAAAVRRLDRLIADNDMPDLVLRYKRLIAHRRENIAVAGIADTALPAMASALTMTSA